MTSGSSISDSLISHLVAVSACNFDSAAVSGNLTKNDFGLLDTTNSGCVWFVLPPSSESDPNTFGNPVGEQMEFMLTIRSFIRDDNNPVSTLNRVWQAERDFRQAMGANSDLSSGSPNVLANMQRASGWNGNDFILSSGGIAFIPQEFSVKVMVQE